MKNEINKAKKEEQKKYLEKRESKNYDKKGNKIGIKTDKIVERIEKV